MRVCRCVGALAAPALLLGSDSSFPPAEGGEGRWRSSRSRTRAHTMPALTVLPDGAARRSINLYIAFHNLNECVPEPTVCSITYFFFYNVVMITLRLVRNECASARPCVDTPARVRVPVCMCRCVLTSPCVGCSPAQPPARSALPSAHLRGGGGREARRRSPPTPTSCGDTRGVTNTPVCSHLHARMPLSPLRTRAE